MLRETGPTCYDVDFLFKGFTILLELSCDLQDSLRSGVLDLTSWGGEIFRGGRLQWQCLSPVHICSIQLLFFAIDDVCNGVQCGALLHPAPLARHSRSIVSARGLVQLRNNEWIDAAFYASAPSNTVRDVLSSERLKGTA